MHRLRTKKKGRDAEDDVPPVPTAPQSSNFFGKKKAAPVPEEPKVDLEHALPPSDDFRTSLLMPNLASRFSILGKEELEKVWQAASADYPEDAGQDAGFNHTRFRGLGDIDETSPIDGPVPLASANASMSDERRPSDDGTIMNRARGGEGNVLFGGRQKVYKVAASKTLRGGTSSLEDLTAGFGGRCVGQKDVPAFIYSSRQSRDDDEEPEEDKNRYTASSTNSTPTNTTRSSTAATSINSQPGGVASASLPQSPTTKPRRPLYEQALDQHFQDSQTNAMGRLERLASLRRMNSGSPPRSLSPAARSPTSPASRRQMPWTAQAETPLSPPVEKEGRSSSDGKSKKPVAFDSFDFGLTLPTPSPLSPPMSSKANEFPTNGPPTSRSLSSDHDRHRSFYRTSTPASERESSVSLGAVGELNSFSADIREGRSTFLSSSSRSTSRRSSFEPDRAIHYSDDELDEATRGNGRNSFESSSQRYAKKRAEEADVSPPDSPVSVSAASRVSSLSDEPAREFLEALRPMKSHELYPASPNFTAAERPAGKEDDSPTLPTGGLSLLVRQHLRADSGASSMYAESTYRLSRVSRYGVAASITQVPGESRASGVWEFDQFGDRMDDHSDHSVPGSPESTYPVRTAAGNDFGRNESDDEDRGRSRAGSRAGTERAVSRAGTEHSQTRIDDPDDQDWEQQLAFRRQIVQQNLRNQEKIQSSHDAEHTRDSPSKNGNGGPFAALRPKTSGGLSKHDGGKSPVIFGMGSNNSVPQLPGPFSSDQKQRQRPTLNTNQTFGPGNIVPGAILGGGHSATRSDASPHPFGDFGAISAGNTPRGTSPAWKDGFGQPALDARSPPSTPIPPNGPSGRHLSKAGGYNDDLSRAMMTGQSNLAESPIIPVLRRGRANDEETMENVKSTFEEEETRRPTFRRTRGSTISQSNTVKHKGSVDINMSSLGPPPSQPIPPTPGSNEARIPGPTAPPLTRKVSTDAVRQQIQTANSVFAPPTKRVVNKSQIGAPTLLSKTSHIPTINLPAANLSTVPSLPSPAPSSDQPKGRKRTNTLFGAFHRNKTEDDIPQMPSMPYPKSEMDFDEKPKKLGRLRKSISDGGGLSSRARREEASMRPPIPQKPPVPISGGMI